MSAEVLTDGKFYVGDGAREPGTYFVAGAGLLGMTGACGHPCGVEGNKEQRPPYPTGTVTIRCFHCDWTVTGTLADLLASAPAPWVKRRVSTQ